MKILYATDGSEGALGAARFLASLPLKKDIHVHIVTVLDADDPGDGQEILCTAAAALRGFPGQVTSATARGSSTSQVVDAILSAADLAEADLIAVGASGHSALVRFFLGSVAEAVVRHARHPVLVTRPFHLPLQDIVIGVDGSEGADSAAVFAACRLPLPVVCTLRLASVVPQPVFGMIGDPLFPGAPDYLALEVANREARSRALAGAEALADTLRTHVSGPRIVVELVALGHPVTELLRIARERSAGLIVVGSHGLSGMERFLLGSVSERVLQHAPCSVLVFKGPILGKGN